MYKEHVHNWFDNWMCDNTQHPDYKRITTNKKVVFENGETLHYPEHHYFIKDKELLNGKAHAYSPELWEPKERFTYTRCYDCHEEKPHSRIYFNT